MARGVARTFGPALGIVLFALLPAACNSARRPPPPRPLSADLSNRPGPRRLGPYLDAYPLGDRGTRIDLLGFDEERSLHLVQTRRAIPAHRHRTHRERAYVVTGTGTVYVEDRSYPAHPGSTFVLEPGAVHSIHPDEDSVIVAVVYFEPPMGRDSGIEGFRGPGE